jgi:hypothetical protein
MREFPSIILIRPVFGILACVLCSLHYGVPVLRFIVLRFLQVFSEACAGLQAGSLQVYFPVDSLVQWNFSFM